MDIQQHDPVFHASKNDTDFKTLHQSFDQTLLYLQGSFQTLFDGYQVQL